MGNVQTLGAKMDRGRDLPATRKGAIQVVSSDICTGCARTTVLYSGF